MPEPPLPALADIAPAALFLDFDGTLVDFADHPDGVTMEADTIDALQRLQSRLKGALAIISGREIESLDRFLAPLKLPAAGVHGLARRDHTGIIETSSVDLQALARITERLHAFVRPYPELLVEEKRQSVALHYRRAPQLRGQAIDAIGQALSDETGFSVLHGKMVLEARSALADKGRAISAFMKERPFAGRIAVFAGDDVTDEDGFGAVNAMGGVSIKVGHGESVARHRLSGPAALRNWLVEQAAAEDRTEWV